RRTGHSDRGPLLFRDLAGRAGRRRFAQGGFLERHPPFAVLLRSDPHRRGAVAPDRGHDLIQTLIGSSISVSARNLVMFVGGLILMFVTSVKLTLLVTGAVVLVMIPLIAFGRWVRTLSRRSQDRIADTS